MSGETNKGGLPCDTHEQTLLSILPLLHRVDERTRNQNDKLTNIEKKIERMDYFDRGEFEAMTRRVEDHDKQIGIWRSWLVALTCAFSVAAPYILNKIGW